MILSRYVLIALLFYVGFVLAERVDVLKTKDLDKPTEPTPSTIIDILSSDVQYSYFLRELQRKELIPFLNTLENVTLFAPVNLAYAEGARDVEDKDAMKRYIGNSRIRVAYMGRKDEIFESLYHENNKLYPLKISPDFELRQYIVDNVATIVETDRYAKHQNSFIQSIDKLLPLKPTICEVFENDTMFPQSISIFKRLLSSLFDPYNESFLLKYSNNPELSGFNKLKLARNCEEFLRDVRTVIVPTDAYLKHSLSDISIKYYLALNSSILNSMTPESIIEIKQDIAKFLKSFMLAEYVGGQNGTHEEHKSINGQTTFNTSLMSNSSVLILNGAISSTPKGSNIVVGDGILHVFDLKHNSPNLLQALGIPSAQMIPRKVLYALHFSKFVQEVYFRSMGDFIDGKISNQTIFLELSSRDDIVDGDFLNSMVSFSAKQKLQYQFNSPMIDVVKELRSSNKSINKLLDSGLCSKKKIGSCFRAKISAWTSPSTPNQRILVNGDVDVIGLPIIAEGNSIMVLEEEMVTPSSFKDELATLVSNGGMRRNQDFIDVNSESLLEIFQDLKKFGLLSFDENSEGYSVFLPCGYRQILSVNSEKISMESPWDSLGLTLTYLKNNPSIFKKVFKSMIIDGLIYSDFGINDVQNVTTVNLLGDLVEINKEFNNDDRNIITINNSVISVPLNSDILFSQGVLHITNKVLLPEWLEISLLDLLETTENKKLPEFSFLTLIDHFPTLRKQLGISNVKTEYNYSFLVPNSKSLSAMGIDSEFDRLYDLIQFHLIPNSELPKLLECVEAGPYCNNKRFIIKTNLTDTTLSCTHDDSTGRTKLNLVTSQRTNDRMERNAYNRDHEIFITSYGCTGDSTTYADMDPHEISCVFLVDKPLNLDWFGDSDDNFLHIHFGALSFIFGITLGLVLFSMLLFAFVLFLSRYRGRHLFPVPAVDPVLPQSQPNIMKIQPQGETVAYDRGYETDEDMLLPGPSRFPVPSTSGMRNYKSTDNEGNKETAPRWIKNNDIMKTLNRNRNLPSGF